MSAANYVRMTPRDDESKKSVPIPVSSVPNRCDHTARVCVECLDTWERDYIVHFRRTAPGRRLKEARDALRREAPGLTRHDGPPSQAAMTRQQEVLVQPRHIAEWRDAGPGSWLVALPGQVVIRRDDRRAPGVVEIGPYERLATIAESLSAQGGEPTDRDLARACTGIAADLLPDTVRLDAWAEQAEELHAAMTARGLARAAVTTTTQRGTDVFLQRWHQRYRRTSDGAQAGVMLIETPRTLLVSLTAWSRTATATLPTSHREYRQIAAALADAACRMLDGEHPGPLWNADSRDYQPGRGHALWRITHAVIAEIAEVTEGPHAQLRALPDLVSAAVKGACTAADCPASARAWVRRQVTYQVLRAAEIPTCGPRDRRNPALLACLAHGHHPTIARQMRHAARITADTAPARRG